MTASLPRFAIKTGLVLAGVCALGIFPVERWASAQGVVAWSVAFAVVFVGAILGALPAATAFGSTSLEARAQAWLIGLGLRLLFLLGACLAVWLSRAVLPSPFLAGTGIGYAIVLALEVASASRLLRETAPRTPAPRADGIAVETPRDGVASGASAKGL